MQIKISILSLCISLFVFTNISKSQQINYVKGELLVQITKEKNIDEIISSHLYSNGIATEAKVKKPVSRNNRIWLVSFDENKISIDEMMREMQTNKNIEIVQKNHIITYRSTTPNDPKFSQQWQYINNGANGGVAGADIDADLAWDFTTGGLTATGDTIVVAIIDEGFDTSHTDLKPNRWFNYNEIPSNSTDDDGNGYTDDYKGWNDDKSNDDISGGAFWTGTHGTCVAGIVGAKGDNNIGVSGVNWNVKLMLVVGGGNEAQAVSSYSYVLEMRKLYNETNGAKGAFVVSTNASWGIDQGQPASAPLWCAMYDTLGKYGILNCGATANQNWNIDSVGDLPTACPSNYLIAVTNTKNNDVKETSAGYGIATIDLGSPGTDTYTVAKGNTYAAFGGTSGATPHVTGTIGLLYSLPCPAFMYIAKNFPDSAAMLMRQFILTGVDSNASLLGITATGGRLNMYGSVLQFNNFCSTIDTTNTVVENFIDKRDGVFSIYPNPNDGKFWMQVTNQSRFTNLADRKVTYELKIYNILEELIYRLPITDYRLPITIDLSGKPAGMYFVSLKLGNEIAETKKLVITE